MNKKLTLSPNKKVSGVCAGIAEYFDIDPTIIRIIYAALTLFSFGIGGIVLYLVLAFIMPSSDKGQGYQK